MNIGIKHRRRRRQMEEDKPASGMAVRAYFAAEELKRREDFHEICKVPGGFADAIIAELLKP